MAHSQFKHQFDKFSTKFKTLTSPSNEQLLGQRAETKFMSYKIGFITHALLSYLYSKDKYLVLSFCIDKTPQQLGNIVTEFIDTKRVFNDLSRISIKEAHEKLLALGKVPYKDDVLSIAKTGLFEEFRKCLMVEIFYAIMSYGESLREIKPKVAEDLSRDVQYRVFYKNLLVNIESLDTQAYMKYTDLIQSILEIFISSEFFIKSVRVKQSNKPVATSSKKTPIQLILPKHIAVDAYRPMKFPNIVRPKKLNKRDVDKLIKPLINGKGDITKSDRLVKTLNISRSKPHKVNELFLSLSEKFFPRD